MTLDHLRYFAAVATYQHVGRAAKSVFISPSVISSAIASLQAELQCELFRKNGRRIELTDHGKRLLEQSKSILANVEGLKTSLKGSPEELRGQYRLGASHFLTPRILLKGWLQLQKQHPKMVGEIYSMNTAHAIADVIAGRLDIAACFSPLPHPDLKESRVGSGIMVVVVKKNHPVLKKSQKEQLDYLKTEGAVIHKAAQGVESCESHPVFDRLGFQPRIDVFYDDDDVALQTVLQSEKWAFVPDIVASAHADKLQIIKLPKNAGYPPYYISVLWHRGRDFGSAFQDFTSSIREECERLGMTN